MPDSIAFAQNYTSVIDEVYQRASVSGVLNSGRRMVRAGHNAKEVLIPKISVTGLGDYTRNVGYKTGAITYEFETKTFNYDRGIRLFADVMDVEEVGVRLLRGGGRRAAAHPGGPGGRRLHLREHRLARRRDHDAGGPFRGRLRRYAAGGRGSRERARA